MDITIYDQEGHVLDSYDTAKGYLRSETRTVHHDAVESVPDVGHWETVKEYPETGGKDVRWVVDKKGVVGYDAWDEQVDVAVFVPYTEEELAAQAEAVQQQADRENMPYANEDALCELAEMIAAMEAEIEELKTKLGGEKDG